MDDEDKQYNDEEIARRRDDLARHMLNTPPRPLNPAKPKTRPVSKGRVHKEKTRV